MSFLQRFTPHKPLAPHQPIATVTLIEPPATPRLRFPDGAFAALVTSPPELADEAYSMFDKYRVTPGVGERHVAEVLAAATALSCLPVETSPGFAYAAARERTELGRMRVFAHTLVHMQFAYETNLRELRAFRLSGIKHVQILPGCCDVCDALANRRYRLADAPTLPVHSCLRHGGCKCTYAPTVE
jgi:hypothetical protein